MANDPSYVRLSTRLSKGIQADVNGSGWSISGLDVKEFPSDYNSANYVRKLLNSGVLEPASKAEWEEVQDDPAAEEYLRQLNSLPKIDGRTVGWQEAQVQEAVQRRTAELEQKRLEATEEEEDEEELVRRTPSREERIAQQKEMGLNTDDPEEQVNRALVGRPKKTAKKSSRRPADDQ